MPFILLIIIIFSFEVLHFLLVFFALFLFFHFPLAPCVKNTFVKEKNALRRARTQKKVREQVHLYSALASRTMFLCSKFRYKHCVPEVNRLTGSDLESV